MPWKLGLVLGLIFAVFGGVGGFICGATIGIVLSLLFKSATKPTSRQSRGSQKHSYVETTQRPPPLPFQEPQMVKVTSSRGKGAHLSWVEPGIPISVQGISIPGGMIYQSAKPQGYSGEPSAICSSLTVGRVPADPSLDMGYYPSYEQISSAHRRTYLDWLAAGRTDANPGGRSLGYLFLFFYGLERRILIEKDSDQRLVEEILRLLALYAPAHKSRSLRSYFIQLAHFAGWRLGPQAYRRIWPQLLEYDGERPNQDGLRFVLANLHQTGEPMDWTVAYRLALGNEDCRRSIVIKKAQAEFWTLFQHRFEERFPGGMPLEAGKQMAPERYRPASSAFYTVAEGSPTLSTKIPNVAGLHRQFAFLPDLWNSCINDLSGYSRTISSGKGGDIAGWLAWQALPRELQAVQPHPLKQQFDEIVTSAGREDDAQIVPVASLAAMIGLAEKAKLTPTDSIKVCEAVESFGYSLSPDTRLSGVPLTWEQEVVLLPVSIAMTHHLAGLTRLSYLAFSIAAADGFVEDSELERFHRLIAPEIDSDETRFSLKATTVSLKRDANVAVKAFAQIAKKVPEASRLAVLKTMIHIAAADGEVGLDELKMLRKMARAFDLEPDLAEKLVREDTAFGEVIVEAGKGSAPAGEKIPAKKVPFELDTERIKALTRETHEVISLLSEVMMEEEEIVSAVSVAAPEPAMNAEHPEWLETLDERYRSACMEVIAHDALPVETFDAIAKKHHLFPDDLFTAINGWSDEQLGDFLLERDNEVRVFRDLLPDRYEISNSL